MDQDSGIRSQPTEGQYLIVVGELKTDQGKWEWEKGRGDEREKYRYWVEQGGTEYKVLSTEYGIQKSDIAIGDWLDR
jgi:hypothetical protein